MLSVFQTFSIFGVINRSIQSKYYGYDIIQRNISKKMRTKGTALLDKFQSAIKEIERLVLISHNEDDYSDIIKSIGGEVEKFLKSTIFQGTKNNKNFNELINELAPLGIPQEKIDFLHTFRKTYNSYKHDANYTSSIESCKEILKNAQLAIDDINNLGIGSVNKPNQVQSKRTVWLAGWDDYIGGMTEVSIFIPDNSFDFPPAIEHFNIDINGWYPVIEKFQATGELLMGEEHIPDNIYKIWMSGSDFMGAGKFTGDIAELVKDLSSYINKDKEALLLSDLKRKNDFSSAKTAIILSLYDTLKCDLWKDFSDLIDEVRLRASYDYGIDVDSVYAQKILSCIREDILVTNRQMLKNLTDIIWTDLIGYEKCTNKQEICKEVRVAFDSIDKLIIQIR
ncbi:hypothetical protein M2138_002022 [Dysgonomonadaceae bacterium PH5-43]|nr:hypothetical protein [Dysgonomonadaceae bacterium PH5-43]